MGHHSYNSVPQTENAAFYDMSRVVGMDLERRVSYWKVAKPGAFFGA